MKHYGDIQKIDGHKVPLVDIITAVLLTVCTTKKQF
jgi:hypothetical protein